MHVVVPLFQDRSRQSWDLARIVLSVSRHYYNELEMILERVFVPLTYGVAYSVPCRIPNCLDRDLNVPTGLIYAVEGDGPWFVSDDTDLVDGARFKSFENTADCIGVSIDRNYGYGLQCRSAPRPILNAAVATGTGAFMLTTRAGLPKATA